MSLLHDSMSSEPPQTTQLNPQNAENSHEGGSKSHKKTKSSGILGSLSFLRSKDSVATSQKTATDELGQPEDVEITRSGPSIVTALRQSHGRQRKGSLRQAAMAKMRERSGSLRKERAAPIITTTMSVDSPQHESTPRPAGYSNRSVNSSSDAEHLSPGNHFGATRISSHQTPQLLQSPISSPGGPYASTTDEDDHMSFYRPAASSSASSFNVSSQGPAMSLSRRRSNRGEQRIQASAVPTTPELDLDEEWDYSETEWWGWVVLIATWVVFVVGMGSCLGVWSWAWDVGETPYAPPDLEDDDTLPITGYYPALMVCTAVMAWVWVVVAWVGMKYFRHAKVGVDG
ncbi:hypothetical protein J1614_006040 [Plenodomus biglobosus]|nr:hypothetical protein J1614_006040 [Plenodomus biglobosus]